MRYNLFESGNSYENSISLQVASSVLNNIAGLSQKQISVALGYSREKISKHLNKKIKKKRARPRKLTGEMVRYLNNKLLMDPKYSVRALKNDLNKTYGTNFAKDTIHRQLKREGLKSIICKNKPKLKESHIDLRYTYCSLNPNTFNNVVFVDESTFYVQGNKVRIWTKGRSRKENPTENVNLFEQNRRIKVNVIGAIAPVAGRVFLQFISSNMDQHQFHHIFSNELLPAINEKFGNDFKVQLDNAPYHNSKMMNEFYEDNGIKLLEQPPISPDLNPIERLWYHMKCKVAHLNPPTQGELEESIKRVWDDTSDSRIKLYICKHYEIVDRVYREGGEQVFE